MLALLGLGTTAGIVVMALALYPALRRSGPPIRWHLDRHHPAVRRAVRLSGWTFGYVIGNQVAAQVINILATPGSGGVRDYLIAYQFFQLPHGLLAVSIMTTFEPILGRASARRDWRHFNAQLLLGLRLVGLLVIPAAIGYLAIPSGLGFGTLGTTGSLASVLRLTAIVAAFAVGLPGFSVYLFVLRAFYALKDTRTPFYLNTIENAINIVTAVFFVHWWGIVGLALSFAVSYTIAAWLAFAVLMQRSRRFDRHGLLITLTQLLGRRRGDGRGRDRPREGHRAERQRAGGRHDPRLGARRCRRLLRRRRVVAGARDRRAPRALPALALRAQAPRPPVDRRAPPTGFEPVPPP